MIQRDVYFSYGQFMVFDRSVKLPGLDWTESHFYQGFARRESVVCVRALDEFSNATVRVRIGPYAPTDQYARVIAVPFEVTSGAVAVVGPEGEDADGEFELKAGSYRLVIAQAPIGEGFEEVDLFFDPTTASESHSDILVWDGDLTPPSVVVETASIAGAD